MPVLFLYEATKCIAYPFGGMLIHHDYRIAFSPTGIRSVWQNKHNKGVARTLKKLAKYFKFVEYVLRLKWGHFHGNSLHY